MACQQGQALLEGAVRRKSERDMEWLREEGVLQLLMLFLLNRCAGMRRKNELRVQMLTL